MSVRQREEVQELLREKIRSICREIEILAEDSSCKWNRGNAVTLMALSEITVRL